MASLRDVPPRVRVRSARILAEQGRAVAELDLRDSAVGVERHYGTLLDGAHAAIAGLAALDAELEKAEDDAKEGA